MFLDFVAVNAYVFNMFLPLNFLGSIYGWVVQALVDIKNLSQLLSEHIEVTDVENAQPLPFMADKFAADKSMITSTDSLKNHPCKQCGRILKGDVESDAWRFCPYCGADTWRSYSQSSHNIIGNMNDTKSRGISVKFKS